MVGGRRDVCRKNIIANAVNSADTPHWLRVKQPVWSNLSGEWPLYVFAHQRPVFDRLTLGREMNPRSSRKQDQLTESP